VNPSSRINSAPGKTSTAIGTFRKKGALNCGPFWAKRALGAKRFCPCRAFADFSSKRSADIAARCHHAENATAATDPTGEERNSAAVKVVALSFDAFAKRSRADLH
jgi:hypothetical protein